MPVADLDPFVIVDDEKVPISKWAILVATLQFFL
jgi:hypothetical protein